MVNAVAGLNWGDEGKGRIVDYLAADADCVIRYQGGDNAGHTVVNGYGRFALHNMPSGIFNKKCLNIIAPGSVINLESFLDEEKSLNQKGIPTDNLVISDRAAVILPFHILLDKLEEERLGDKKYGSTQSGISPIYGLRHMKKAIQIGELLHPSYLAEHIRSITDYINLQLCGVYNSTPVKAEEVFEQLIGCGASIRHHIADIGPIVSGFLEKGKKIILEAQLGALRDINHGIYPYTTSSPTLAGYACASVPIPPRDMGSITGVAKAYSTCVGEGPFVTEMEHALANKIRVKAGEFGAKTGRPRRIGYFDAVATSYGCRLQGASNIALTCLDILGGMGRLKICTGYITTLGSTGVFPINPVLAEAKPEYEILEGWDEDISEIRRYMELPINARKYVERIEELVGVKISLISVGPERNAIIIREE